LKLKFNVSLQSTKHPGGQMLTKKCGNLWLHLFER